MYVHCIMSIFLKAEYKDNYDSNGKYKHTDRKGVREN